MDKELRAALNARKAELGHAKLQLVNAPPRTMASGIEAHPPSVRIPDGFMSCVYCDDLISERTYQRTCPVCATKFRTTFGAYWYTLSWHTDLTPGHVAFCAERPLPMGYKAEQVTEAHTQYSPELLAVSVEYQEVYAIVTAIRETKGFGKHRVAEELVAINKQRVSVGASPLPVPHESTIDRWCGDVPGVEEVVAELHAGGMGARRISKRLTELNLPSPSLSTIKTWNRNRAAA